MDPRDTVGRIYKEELPCFPIVSLWELVTPGMGPFLTPGSWLAGILKRTTIYCYTQNMKALGLVVLEKKIFFSHCKSMGAINDPWSGATFDPRGMVVWLPTFTILVTCVIKYHLHNF